MGDIEDDGADETSFFFKRARLIPQVVAEDMRSNISTSDDFEPGDALINDKKSDKSKDCEVVDVEKDSVASDSPQVHLTKYAVQKLARRKKKREKELEILKKMTNEVIFDTQPPVEEIVIMEEDEDTILLKFSYLSKIAKLKCNMNEKFSSILPKAAGLFKLRPTELMLCLQEKNIQLSDSPKSLNMTIADVIECFPYKLDEKESLNDERKLQIFFQSENSKEKIAIFVHKLEKMEEVLKKYSEIRSIPTKDLVFEFDGEVIKGCETPDDLGLESENCIDVKIITSEDDNPRKKNRKKSPSVVTLD